MKEQFEARAGMTAESEGKGVRGEGCGRQPGCEWARVESGDVTWNLHNGGEAGMAVGG
jgi:hypothetical protein